MSKKPFNYDILTCIFILKKKIQAHLNEEQGNERECQQRSVICWCEIQVQNYFRAPRQQTSESRPRFQPTKVKEK